MQYNKKISFIKGFTLVELMVVLSILALLTGIIFSTLVDTKNSQSLEKDTDTVVEILLQARSQTLSSHNASQYGVHFSSPNVTLFAGTSYSSSDPNNSNFKLSSSDTILTISLAGGGNDVIFNRLSGETIQNGSIILSSVATSRTKTVTIYKTGLVEYK